ncbi:RES domain-containing protein [Butyricimonas virosa]|jgi:hypothetical protein|uniref:RES domain-containing protein n=1 Tax=Butyricimonas virosa TaxID=544645 RepID=UPI000E4354A9|nr:RES domain-containing protein [Butyricimonas virosa]RGL84156.1 hypothetical protein DXC42_14665 [Butyricimonas virosa]
MKIDDFILHIPDLFIEDETSQSDYIIDRLTSQRLKLFKLINEFDVSDRVYLGVRNDTIKSNVKELYDSIIKSVQCFLDGHFEKSRNIIYNTFFNRDNPKRKALPIRRINAFEIFYRIRESQTYNLYSKEEMFHIPFEKRGLVSNQRYSISGYPCLYLGSSIYNCWEETNRPNIDTCNIVGLRNLRTIDVIDLSIPQMEKMDFNAESIYNLVLPLVCSLKVKNNANYFKTEYIVTQNILGCIIMRNSISDEPIELEGIQYTSTFYGQKQCMFTDKKLLTNYVFPIKKSKKMGLCDELWASFEMTKPTSLTQIRLTEDKTSDNNNFYKLWNRKDERNSYERSILGFVESKLRGYFYGI